MAGWKALPWEKEKPWQPLSALQKVTRGQERSYSAEFSGASARNHSPAPGLPALLLAWLDYSGERFSLEVGLLASAFCRGLLW
jgi:hypothetical protein